jgi:hypothetical protein
MSHNLKDQINDAGKKVAEGVSQAADWVKEKTGLKGTTDLSGVREHMEVIASCGTKVGVVDHVEGGAIKLTRNSTDGQHHFLPASMVQRVDQHVHLNCNHLDAMKNWKSDAASCNC